MDQPKSIDALPVLHLWIFKLRCLAVAKSERAEFEMTSASAYTTEREVVAEIKNRFTPEWWAGVLLQDVVYAGKLHMIAGVPLYEKD